MLLKHLLEARSFGNHKRWGCKHPVSRWSHQINVWLIFPFRIYWVHSWFKLVASILLQSNVTDDSCITDIARFLQWYPRAIPWEGCCHFKNPFVRFCWWVSAQIETLEQSSFGLWSPKFHPLLGSSYLELTWLILKMGYDPRLMDFPAWLWLEPVRHSTRSRYQYVVKKRNFLSPVRVERWLISARWAKVFRFWLHQTPQVARCMGLPI